MTDVNRPTNRMPKGRQTIRKGGGRMTLSSRLSGRGDHRGYGFLRRRGARHATTGSDRSLMFLLTWRRPARAFHPLVGALALGLRFHSA